MGSRAGCLNETFSRPCFLSTNCLTMPEFNGPGRYRATKAPMSSNVLGFKSLTSAFIPPDSSWKIPSVSPLVKISYTFGSSKGRFLISICSFLVLPTSLMVFSIMVKFRRPRKSILSKPSFSRSPIGNCATSCFSLENCRGTTLWSGSFEITTPAACTPTLQAVPSIFSAKSTSCLVCGLVSYSFLRGIPSFKASASCVPGMPGIILASLSLSENGTSITRATAFNAALAARVPKVIIWLTRSLPYFSVTYLITRSRLSMQKSISISGIDTRSGFKNRSNSKLCSSGSISVMPRA